MGLGVLEGAADRRVGGDWPAIDLVALDHAEGKPEREGRVGVDGIAFVVEEGPGDERVVGRFDSLDLVFVDLAHAACIGVDGQGQLDHRVVEASIAALPPFGELFPQGDVGELRCRARNRGRPRRGERPWSTRSTNGSSGITCCQWASESASLASSYSG